MNNFERIKNMSLEEMAEWLEDFVYEYTAGHIEYQDAKEYLEEQAESEE